MRRFFYLETDTMISVHTITDDNLPRPRQAEHGLALWVDVSTPCGACEHILLDCGQRPAVLTQNALRAGIDLAAATAIVLSHGHYDHTGGLPALADAHITCPVFVGPDAERRRFSTQVGIGASGRKMLKPIGMPSPDALAQMNVCRITGTEQASDSLTLFSLPAAAPPNPRLLAADGLSPDYFSDEIFALITDGARTLLFGGCTHHGLPMLLDHVFHSMAIPSVDCFVGGLHLQGRPDDEVQAVADIAARYPVAAYAPIHCSGAAAQALWRERFRVIEDVDFRL